MHEPGEKGVLRSWIVHLDHKDAEACYIHNAWDTTTPCMQQSAMRRIMYRRRRRTEGPYMKRQTSCRVRHDRC